MRGIPYYLNCTCMCVSAKIRRAPEEARVGCMRVTKEVHWLGVRGLLSLGSQRES